VTGDGGERRPNGTGHGERRPNGTEHGEHRPNGTGEPGERSAFSRARRDAAIDVALLCGVKLALCAYVLRSGFSHVSDDDYARTVIAERFAHAPRLDPSGTSWLPMPFWIEGAAMMVAGRSLGVARAVAVALGTACVAAPYLAMRSVHVERVTAAAATAIAMMIPWNAWLGAATVPEGWTGALIGASLLGMASDRARPWAAAALLVTSLSRYEAWPACAVFAALCVARARRSNDDGALRETACALVAIAGPSSWMLWNAAAHGSATHFLTRVSAFRRATGAAEIPLRDKWLGFPRALAAETPEMVGLAAVGLGGLVADATLRARWGWTVAAVVAILAFLVIGDLHDGAPTHHPARALSPLWWVIAGVGADAVALALRAAHARVPFAGAACVVAATVVWCGSLPGRWNAAPGRTEWERRDPQIARGLAMRASHVASAVITPCAFEDFALLAAWGEPERARVNPSRREPPTADCPTVVVEP
jgi:hypothetical protein